MEQFASDSVIEVEPFFPYPVIKVYLPLALNIHRGRPLQDLMSVMTSETRQSLIPQVPKFRKTLWRSELFITDSGLSRQNRGFLIIKIEQC